MCDSDHNSDLYIILFAAHQIDGYDFPYCQKDRNAYYNKEAIKCIVNPLTTTIIVCDK